MVPVSLLVSKLDKAWLLSPTASLKLISPISVSVVSPEVISVAFTVKALFSPATERTVELKVTSLPVTVVLFPSSIASLKV